MADRRCFVQFPHPGGEHKPDGSGHNRLEQDAPEQQAQRPKAKVHGDPWQMDRVGQLPGASVAATRWRGRETPNRVRRGAEAEAGNCPQRWGRALPDIKAEPENVRPAGSCTGRVEPHP